VAAPVYTARFAAFSTDAGGFFTVFTASDAWVWIIRDIVITSFSVDPAALVVYIGSPVQNWPILGVPAAAYGQSYHWDGRQELLPAEEISLQVDRAPTRLIITGYKLLPQA
jgi:hypothetical protein